MSEVDPAGEQPPMATQSPATNDDSTEAQPEEQKVKQEPAEEANGVGEVKTGDDQQPQQGEVDMEHVAPPTPAPSQEERPPRERAVPQIPPSEVKMSEALPVLTQEENSRINELTSLDFNRFYGLGDPRQCVEANTLFKANRIYEARLEKLMREDEKEVRNQLFVVYKRIGHISLLSQDFAKALSAYQKAYQMNEDNFWKDPSGFYGLGLVYLHFKNYKFAADALNRVLYTFPNCSVVAEVHARLGVAYKALEQYHLALKHFNSSLNDVRDSAFLSKTHLKFNIALCYDSADDLERAYAEYRELLAEQEQVQQQQGGQLTEQQTKLHAAIYRQLGWICYRTEPSVPIPTGVPGAVQTGAAGEQSEERLAKLNEAEQWLLRAKQLEPGCGKTYYYLGRCFGENTIKAHDAFVNYRHSIDKSEADADTWCSIGVLYQQQNQPMDALQAFICAVELDPEHSAAWTDLARLYELNAQFPDALACYKQAVRFQPAEPEPLKARIAVLEKELAAAVNPPKNSQQQNRLPSLKDAWSQPIPSELRQRQDEFLKVKQQRYRDGSALWRMGQLAAPQNALSPQQSQMLQVLRMNRERLSDHERSVLANLEEKAEAAVMDPVEVLASSSLPMLDEDDGLAGVKGECDAAHPLPSRSRLEADMEQLGELPECFSLLSNIHVPLDISSSELMEVCMKRVQSAGAHFKPVFDEKVAPPCPPRNPTPPKGDCKPVTDPATAAAMVKSTPLIVVESKKDAHSVELQRFCEGAPIALVRGLTAVLKMDLSLFSTKTLLETAPEHEVEVRTQYRMPCEQNVDQMGRPTWECHSQRSFTTIVKYASYQAETFKHSLKEESDKLRATGAKYGAAASGGDATAAKRRKGAVGEEPQVPMKMLKFGTNVDLSDDVKFKAQLTELAKMPPFARLIAGCNALSHLGHTVLGMNTLQLYMKVPGSRTPGHQENNNMSGINVNIGPGDCEWFAVPYEWWGVVEQHCRKRGIDYLKGSWWPNFEDLISEGVPVYKFTQKAGDLVWIGSGCVHWVQSTGWCNNIAWNVCPLTPTQLTMSIHSYEWNRLQGYKSLVPMQHLCWQLAKNIRFTNQKVYQIVKSMLIRSLAYCKMIYDFSVARGKKIKIQTRQKGEVTHYCSLCEIEVFNILFVKEQNGKFPVFCVDCARRGRFDEYLVLQQIPFVDLHQIFDQLQLNLIQKVPLVC